MYVIIKIILKKIVRGISLKIAIKMKGCCSQLLIDRFQVKLNIKSGNVKKKKESGLCFLQYYVSEVFCLTLLICFGFKRDQN